jgi:tryptophan synthase beta chain
MKLAKQRDVGAILLNCSGRGDKDIDYVVGNYGYGDAS